MAPRAPAAIADFLACRRIAVAGVSRAGDTPANAIFRKLRAAGYETVPVNPRAEVLEGERCYPDVLTIPGAVDGLVLVTTPAVSTDVVRQAAARGIDRIWLHRSFGDGSVSEDAIRACTTAGITPIVGGCPMMFCPPVDIGHRCMRWYLQRRGRVPRE